MRPLLIGEDNPRSTDPRFALYPYPDGCAGHRLSRILNLTRRKYLRAFERMNLCRQRWMIGEARVGAFVLLMRAHDEQRPLILLGAKVARAFNLEFEPFARYGNKYLLPHPSGLNRIWNDPRAAVKARALLAEFIQ